MIRYEQAEAEVVPSSSLVEVEIEVGVGVKVEVGVEIEVGVEVGLVGGWVVGVGWLEKSDIKLI